MMDKAAGRTIFEFTVGEMQRVLVKPRFWLGFVAVVTMLAISGPFNTTNTMPFPERLAFWLLTAGLTFGAGFFVSLFCGEWLQRSGLGEIAARILAGMIAGVPVAIIVWLIGLLLFEFNVGHSFASLLFLTGQCAGISAAISLLFVLFPKPSEQEAEKTAADSKRDTTFFDRLPVHLGQDLISLQAQDHYLKVTTVKGSEMVLLRLSDACKELIDLDGLQVHRSWWVRSAHVARMEKTKSRISLVLSDGQEIPVSRGFASEVKRRFAQLENVG